MDPFATVDDYLLRYPADETLDEDRIAAALADAQDMIATEAGDVSGVSPATLLRLTCLAASRALKAQDSALDGLSSLQRTAGPFSVMLRPANASGGCYLLDSEWAQLGVGVARFGSVSMLPTREGA